MNTAFRSRRELSRLGGLLLVLLIIGPGYTRAPTQDRTVVVGAAGLTSGSPVQVDFGEVVYGGRQQAYVTVVNESRDSLALDIPWVARWSGGLQVAETSVPPGARRTVRLVFEPNLFTLLWAPHAVPVRYARSNQPLVLLSGKAAFPPVGTASLVDFFMSFASPWDQYLGYRIAAVITGLGLLALLLWVGIPAVTDRLRARHARTPTRSFSPSRAAARFVQNVRSRRERPAAPAVAGQPAPGTAATAPRQEAAETLHAEAPTPSSMGQSPAVAPPTEMPPAEAPFPATLPYGQQEETAAEQGPAFGAPSVRAADVAEPAAPPPIPMPEQAGEAADVPADPMPGAAARAEAARSIETAAEEAAAAPYAAEQAIKEEAGFAPSENGVRDASDVEQQQATAGRSMPGTGQPGFSEPERQERLASPAEEDAAGRTMEKPRRRGWRRRADEQDPFTKVVAAVQRHLGRMKALRHDLASTPRSGSLQDTLASLRTRWLFASIIRSLTRHMRKHDVVKIENFQVLWIVKTVSQQMERTQTGAIRALDEAQQETASWLAAQRTGEPEALPSAVQQALASPRSASRALPVR